METAAEPWRSWADSLIDVDWWDGFDAEFVDLVVGTLSFGESVENTFVGF